MIGLLAVLVPVVVAALTQRLYERFQGILTFVSKWPAWLTRIAVSIVAYGLALLVLRLIVAAGVGSTADLPTVASAALGATVGAYLFHLGDQMKKLIGR